ncbi:unnamed protein product [Diatraea saccharalis]|uniref:Uncharacterized protein n=1 Tax=Diatraea saccharalis TaxID=40085 RepID=A0A9N9WGF2_9NEOP|nr:unnamed protein product [Diatraea saccharalis]
MNSILYECLSVLDFITVSFGPTVSKYVFSNVNYDEKALKFKMEANDFVTRFKANGNEKDLCDLHQVYEDYKVILTKLSIKAKEAFALNILCIICRQVPMKWNIL